MVTNSHERGQALILIVFAIVALVGMTGLAVDGGMAYSDRRNAQNAADGAALAAALGNIRQRDITTTADSAAAVAGFANDHVNNTVTVTVATVPSGKCPDMTFGKDITVEINSIVQAYFAPVLGIRQLHNTVRATARSCSPFRGPLFNGNAIVALTPTGVGFDAKGTPNWLVEKGGIFSNSIDSASAQCKGAAGVTAPSVTVVGGLDLKCSTSIGTTTTKATPYQYDDYNGLFPHVPKCDGQAENVDGWWVVTPGADGSKVAFNGTMKFGKGLFCVTNSPGPYHGQITGPSTGGVTFYLQNPNFNIKFNGKANGLDSSLTAEATTACPIDFPKCDFVGVLMYSLPKSCVNPLTQTQDIDLRGNGAADIKGSVIVPCASVTMYGNSNGKGMDTQVIAYNVHSGGTADIHITYQASDGLQAENPAWITLLR